MRAGVDLGATGGYTPKSNITQGTAPHFSGSNLRSFAGGVLNKNFNKNIGGIIHITKFCSNRSYKEAHLRLLMWSPAIIVSSTCDSTESCWSRTAQMPP